MIKDIPDYRYPQLAEALKAYGFILDDEHYSLHEYVSASPDKFFYFFTNKIDENDILALLVEDYISGLEYVKDCFSKALDTKLTKIHKVTRAKDSPRFEERKPVKAADTYQPPEDWDELSDYAVDFPPFYFGFLASVVPKKLKQFWVELHDRLEWF
jgi:hypothetical protein